MTVSPKHFMVTDQGFLFLILVCITYIVNKRGDSKPDHGRFSFHSELNATTC